MDQKLPINKNRNRAAALPSLWDFPLASPTLWNPASFVPWWNNDLFDATRRNMDLMFGDFFDNLPIPRTQRQADVTEDAKTVRIKMDVPGLDPEDIDISTGDGLLTISANKEEKQGDVESHYAFSYSTVLPEGADVDNADVNLANNKLSIEIPKKNGGKQAGSRQEGSRQEASGVEGAQGSEQQASQNQNGNKKQKKR